MAADHSRTVNDPWPSLRIPKSTANYYLLDARTIAAQRATLFTQDKDIPVVREPHVCARGTVLHKFDNPDGDTHIYLQVDNERALLLVCEITPQQFMKRPAVGDHVLMCGIWRWDDKGWWEIHPVDYWEPA